uniref:Ig-like domain-containing protein n=1 Tax=Sinocyclocheilus rhinocerous TaxID=307959 RepID=A0A673M6U1_9TELE
MLYCVFTVTVCVISVCLQVTVEGVISGSVVLPCSSAEHDHKLQDIDVFWRHNGSKIVFDIIKGKNSVEQQEPRYKNRTETFPEEYKGGNFNIRLTALNHADAGKYTCLIATFPEEYKGENFNIRLTALNHADAGKYTCLIAHSSEHKTVELIINEPTTENGTKSADQETQKPETDVVTLSSLLWVYIIVAVLILILLIAGFIIGCRKKIQAALFSPVMTEDKEQRKK